MPFTRTTHRFAAWLAMLAMLLGALAPTAAQALVAAKGGSDWVQVCSASGMVWMKTDAPDSKADGKTDGKSIADAARHCPWCSLQGAAGLPPAQREQAHALARHAAPAQATIRSATPATPWPTALSRAPPQA